MLAAARDGSLCRLSTLELMHGASVYAKSSMARLVHIPCPDRSAGLFDEESAPLQRNAPDRQAQGLARSDRVEAGFLD